MSGKDFMNPGSKARRHTTTIVTILVGILISVLAFALAADWERKVNRTHFEDEARNRFEAIKRELTFDLHALMSLKAFFDSSSLISRLEFRSFATPLLALRPALQAVVWTPLVRHAERAHYETEAQQDGFHHYQITERDDHGLMTRASQRPEYLPAHFVEPYEGNEMALGFDLASDPGRRVALAMARDMGTTTATGRVTLFQEVGGKYGVLVFVPIHHRNTPDDSKDAPGDSLKGLVVGVLRIEKTLERSLSFLSPERLDVALYDDSAPPPESFLAYRASQPGTIMDSPEAVGKLTPGSLFEYADHFRVADRQWRVEIKATPGFPAVRKTPSPWMMLGAGLMLTMMLAWYFIVHERAERTLFESEEKYRQLFEMESDAVFLFDKETGRIFEVNPAGSALYGYTREELLQMERADLVPENDRADRVFSETGQRPSVHFRRKKDGTVFLVEMTARHFLWKGREVYVTAVRDVTERIRAEEALRTSYQLYAKAERIGNFGHWDRNLLDDVYSWSEGMYHIFGVNPDEFQTTYKNFLGLVHPSDREQFKEELATAISLGKTFELEYRIIRPDGEERVVRGLGEVRLDEDGRAIGTFGISQDITEQKMAELLLKEGEARYRSLFKNNHAVMLLVDPVTGVIVDANPAACAFYGYEYDELLTLTNLDITTLTAAEVRAEMEHARAEQRNQLYFPARLANGQIRDVEVYTSPISVAGKRLLHCIVNDITDRKRAEGKLRQTNDYLENIFENSPDGIGIVDRDGRFIRWNRMAAEQYGYSSEELKGLLAFDFYADKDQLNQMLAKLNRDGAVRRCAIDMKRRDGTVATFEISISLLKDPAGKTLGSVCVARDLSDIKKALTALEASNQRLQLEITERKRVAETLQESERRFREILENIHLLAVSLDLEGRITFCNDFLLNVTGWLQEELLGHDWFELFYPHDVGNAKRHWYYEKVAHGEIETHNEEEIVTCFGRTGLISWNNTLLRNPQGKVIGVTKIGRDVGQRRKMERELREASAEMELLIASIPSILIELSEGNRVIRWNAASEKAFGLLLPEVLGRPLRDCPLQWDWEKVSAALSECRKQGSSIRIDDINFTRPDGKEGLLGVVVSPVKSEQDELLGLNILGEDVTERRFLETQLAQAQKLESIGQLAAGIAHEINTPTQYVGDNTRFLLSAFRDLDQLLDHYTKLPKALQVGEPLGNLVRDLAAAEAEADLTYLREEIPRAIQESLEGVERVTKIVGAMKEFSHPGTTEKAAIDINQAIESTITVARNEWKYVAEMVTDFDPTLSIINCLPGEFNQVILNMIINAAHAIPEATAEAPEKKGTITVTTRNRGDHAEIRVSDTGTGIPVNIRGRIFDPFFTTKEVGKGTGQGLAIAHSVIVDKHGGTIGFESEMGKGTTFIVTLPITDGQDLKGSEA